MRNTAPAMLSRLFELNPDHPGRILPMEGLRGFAVLLVFFVHFQSVFSAWSPAESPLARLLVILWGMGQSGVDLFFVLSGYLIYGAVIRRQVDYGAFMRRRLQRIYPTFLVILGLYIALSFAAPVLSKLPDGGPAKALNILANLLLLPGMLPITGIITVAWSLSYEFFYYLVIPLAVEWTGMRRWSPRTRITAFTGLAVLSLVLSRTISADHVRLTMFLGGIVVYDLLHHTDLLTRVSAALEWVVLLALPPSMLVIAHISGTPTAGFSEFGDSTTPVVRVAVLLLVFGPLVAIAFRSRGALHAVFGWTPLRWLGNMSYSYYLVHGLVLNAVALALRKVVPVSERPDWFMVVAFVVAFTASLAVAAVLFAVVERPLSLDPSARPRRARRPRHAAARVGMFSRMPARSVPRTTPHR